MILNKIYRVFSNFLDQIRSKLKILHLKIKYPSLKIDFKTYVGKNVDIICNDNGKCIITTCHLAKGVYIKVEENAEFILSHTYVGANTLIVSNNFILISEYCSIGESVTIRDQDHEFGNGKLIKDSGYNTGKIKINKNVWLGAKSTVLKNVELGENCVVGAHALVNKSFPANSIIAGIPAISISK